MADVDARHRTAYLFSTVAPVVSDVHAGHLTRLPARAGRRTGRAVEMLSFLAGSVGDGELETPNFRGLRDNPRPQTFTRPRPVEAL